MIAIFEHFRFDILRLFNRELDCKDTPFDHTLSQCKYTFFFPCSLCKAPICVLAKDCLRFDIFVNYSSVINNHAERNANEEYVYPVKSSLVK
jgi:hypothetical protein